MTFQEADAFNAVHGTRFIADLMPRTAIYTAMIPESGRAVMGMPHPSGRAAMRMLETEGFRNHGYIDIFDGGPTLSAATDEVRTIREARHFTLDRIEERPGIGGRTLLAAGQLGNFAACHGRLVEADGVAIDAASAALIGIAPGDPFIAASR
jgi:arginine N-succinyltransferase